MTQPTSQDESDPEAIHLPPGVTLPDRRAFVAGQIWAMLAGNLVALAVLLVLVVSLPAHRRLLTICAALVGLVAAINLVRWLIARRKMPAPPTQPTTDPTDQP